MNNELDNDQLIRMAGMAEGEISKRAKEILLERMKTPIRAGDPIPGVNAVATPDESFFSSLPDPADYGLETGGKALNRAVERLSAREEGESSNLRYIDRVHALEDKVARLSVIAGEKKETDPYRALHLAIVNAVPMHVCTVEMALEWVVRELPQLLKDHESAVRWRESNKTERNVMTVVQDEYDNLMKDKSRMDYLEQDAAGRHTDGLTLRERVDARMQAEQEDATQ